MSYKSPYKSFDGVANLSRSFVKKLERELHVWATIAETAPDPKRAKQAEAVVPVLGMLRRRFKRSFKQYME
jgi:hypothetical protein